MSLEMYLIIALAVVVIWMMITLSEHREAINKNESDLFADKVNAEKNNKPSYDLHAIYEGKRKDYLKEAETRRFIQETMLESSVIIGRRFDKAFKLISLILAHFKLELKEGTMSEDRLVKITKVKK